MWRRGNASTFDVPLMDETRSKTMLVLSRKLGQRFQVGQDVRITIVKIDKQSVRIGIEAPGDVTIYREEIVPLTFDHEVEAEMVRPVKAHAA
jgi:carbon storage regulator